MDVVLLMQYKFMFCTCHICSAVVPIITCFHQGKKSLKKKAVLMVELARKLPTRKEANNKDDQRCILWSSCALSQLLLLALAVDYILTTPCMYYRYTFLSNHNIHKSSSGHCFWVSDHFRKIFRLKCLKPKNKRLLK